MDDTYVVRGGKCGRDLDGDIESGSEFNCSFRKVLAYRLAVDELGSHEME